MFRFLGQMLGKVKYIEYNRDVGDLLIYYSFGYYIIIQ